MVLIDDLIVGFSAAVATASLITMGALLSRYRTLERDAAKGDELAKDIYDSMNSRLAVQDARIVDLMARFEVYTASRKPNLRPVAPPKAPVTPGTSRPSQTNLAMSQPVIQSPAPSAPYAQPVQSEKLTSDTEITILRTLVEGPKTSNQIREVIQVTREHNGRLLKELYDRGYVVRNTQHKPFVYEITDLARRLVGS